MPLQRSTASAWRPSKLGVGAGAATGLLHALAYPGVSAWWLAFVAYVPLMWWLRARRPAPREAFSAGLIAGTLLHAVGHGWLAFTFEKMSGMPAPAAWLVVLLYGLVMGLHQAFWAGACALVQDAFFKPSTARPWIWALGVASLLTAVEFTVPYQFPWFLGNALYPQPVWLQPADLLGIWTVTWLCALLSALIAVGLSDDGARQKVTAAVLAAALVACWYGYGAARIQQIDAQPAARKVTVALIQANPTIAEKTSLKPKPRIPLHDRAEALTATIDRAAVDVFVWPEGSLPFYYVHKEVPPLAGVPSKRNKARTRAPRVVKATTTRVHRFAKALGKPLLLGSLRRTDRHWRQKARNSAILLENGQPVRFYDKRKLVPFGEYVPGTWLVPSLARSIPGVSDLAPGEQSSLIPIAGVRFGVTICYEALFADFMLEHTADAEVLLNLTDDLWFGPTAAPEQHLMVQLPRAIELRRPLLRATATGVSAHIDAVGRVLQRTPVWVTATLVVRPQIRQLDSLFRHVGTWPMRALSALMAVLVAWAVWRRRKPVA